jgi:RNA polymerase sigma-70 factor (ECF subfamily)
MLILYSGRERLQLGGFFFVPCEEYDGERQQIPGRLMTNCEKKPTEDRELLRKASEGDHEAFRRLVEKHREAVFRVCLGFTRDPSEAEDLAQDVFLQVYKSARRFRGGSKVSTWVYRIAVNRSLNYLRKKRTQSWLQALGWASGEEDPLERLPAEEDAPDGLLERKERRRILRDALHRLPENQRVAFTLHNVEGISYEDIASVMGCSISAVESRLHRAKLNLQKYLVQFAKKSL